MVSGFGGTTVFFFGMDVAWRFSVAGQLFFFGMDTLEVSWVFGCLGFLGFLVSWFLGLAGQLFFFGMDVAWRFSVAGQLVFFLEWIPLGFFGFLGFLGFSVAELGFFRDNCFYWNGYPWGLLGF